MKVLSMIAKFSILYNRKWRSTPLASSTVENYLKRLYLEQRAGGGNGQLVSMGRLATAMGVVPGTATAMVKALADSGLVQYSPRTGVQLTDAGTQLALHVLRRHRLLELFLVRIVGLDWSEVHDEAEELEHAISDKLLERIDTLLGHPTADPHGDPIPSSSGHLPPTENETFATCPMNAAVEITRILDQEPRFLQFAEQSGLTPSAKVQVAERNALADAVVLRQGVHGRQLILSTSAARKFLVRRA
jgi:DtxR family Mn-dependent transcriptional regulator